MARVLIPSLAAEYRDRIEHQLRSGLSIQAFCQKEGVKQGAFSTWKRRWKTERQAAVLNGNKTVTSDAVQRGTRQERLIEIPRNLDSSIQVRFADGMTLPVPAAPLALTLQTLQSLQPGGAAHVKPTLHRANVRLFPALSYFESCVPSPLGFSFASVADWNDQMLRLADPT
jgi:transposase-like protein